jgi:hypothetical protein
MPDINLNDIISETTFYSEKPDDPKPGDVVLIDNEIHIYYGSSWGILQGVTGAKSVAELKEEARSELQRIRRSNGWSNADQAVMNLILPEEDH